MRTFDENDFFSKILCTIERTIVEAQTVDKSALILAPAERGDTDRNKERKKQEMGEREGERKRKNRRVSKKTNVSEKG